MFRQFGPRMMALPQRKIPATFIAGISVWCSRIDRLARFQSKRTPVRVKKTRQTKNLKRGPDFIRTGL
jgi:hypothetical protein